jgi:signal transduction histidine kinase
MMREGGAVEAATVAEAARLALVGRTGVAGASACLWLLAGTDRSTALPVIAVIAGWHMLSTIAERQERPRRSVVAVVDVAVVASMALVLPVLDRDGPAYGAEDWVTTATSVTVITAPWIVGLRAAAVTTAALAAAVWLPDQLYAPPAWRAGVEHAVWLMAQGLLSMGVLLLVARGARDVDRLTARLHRRRQDEQVAAMRSADVAAHVAIVHDTVAATLTAAGTASEPGQHFIGLLRRRAMSDLDQLRSTDLLVRARPVDDASRAWFVELAVAPPGTTLDVVLDAGTEVWAVEQPPPAVRQAFAGAVAEALCNAARHSGVSEVVVAVEVENARWRVAVHDRGAGFRLEDVPDFCVGLRCSVGQRMHAAGGWAAVCSTPGHGTTVTLTWPA